MAPAIKADLKKAKSAYQQGSQYEQKQDWQAAYEAYNNAVNWAPDDRDYLLRLELVKSRLIEMKADAAERDAVAGRFDDARRELVEARFLDPTDTVLRDRLAELTAAQSRPTTVQNTAEAGLSGEIHLNYQLGKHKFEYQGTTQGAYEEAAREFGVQIAFDRDLASQPVRLSVDDADFPTVMRLLGPMTGTFWRPLTHNLFFVAQDTPQKRRTTMCLLSERFCARFGNAGSDDGDTEDGPRNCGDYARGFGHAKPHVDAESFTASRCSGDAADRSDGRAARGDDSRNRNFRSRPIIFEPDRNHTTAEC